jgi:hypothetical protein
MKITASVNENRIIKPWNLNLVTPEHYLNASLHRHTFSSKSAWACFYFTDEIGLSVGCRALGSFTFVQWLIDE